MQNIVKHVAKGVLYILAVLICIATFTAAVVLPLTATASAIEPTELVWGSNDDSGLCYIQVTSPTVEELILSSDPELLLYPNDLEIPTKFWDFTSFVGYCDQLLVKDYVAYYFAMYAPDAKVITYAEVKAVEQYLDILYARHPIDADQPSWLPPVLECLRQIPELEEGGNVILESVDTFRGYLVKYRDGLNAQMFEEGGYDNSEVYRAYTSTANDSGLVLGRPMGANLASEFFDFDLSLELQDDLLSYLSTRINVLDMLGCKYVGATRDYDLSFVGRSDTFVDPRPEVEEPIEELLTGETEPSDSGTAAETVAPSVIGDTDADATTDGTVFADDTYQSEAVMTEPEYELDIVSGKKHYNVDDVLVFCAVAVVLVSVVAYGINDWLRKRKDPTRQYPKGW